MQINYFKHLLLIYNYLKNKLKTCNFTSALQIRLKCYCYKKKSFKLKNKYRQRDTTKNKTKKGNVKNNTVNKCSLLL